MFLFLVSMYFYVFNHNILEQGRNILIKKISEWIRIKINFSNSEILANLLRERLIYQIMNINKSNSQTKGIKLLPQTLIF